LSSHPVHGPVGDGVGGVIQHLSHHLAANAGVTAAFDLDQRRNRVLVEKQVIQRHPVSAAFLDWHAHLARDQQPPAGVFLVHLVARQQIWIIS
jgi:hypothetical protein